MVYTVSVLAGQLWRLRVKIQAGILYRLHMFVIKLSKTNKLEGGSSTKELKSIVLNTLIIFK